jgi:hypothetical protein
MITTSKNNSFQCAREICDEQIQHCMECKALAEEKVHPLKRYLRDLWSNIRLFLGTDRWDKSVTLQMNHSHYTMKKEDIEARWRNR